MVRNSSPGKGGVEIIHKKRNYEIETLIWGEEIEGCAHNAIFVNENTIFIRTHTEISCFLYLFELGDKPAKRLQRVY